MPSSGSGAAFKRLSCVAIRTLCHDRPTDCNPPAMSQCSLVAPRRELGVDDRSHGQLTLANAAASHSRAWAHQREVAAHEPARTLQISEDLAGVMRDGLVI